MNKTNINYQYQLPILLMIIMHTTHAKNTTQTPINSDAFHALSECVVRSNMEKQA